MSCLVEVKKFNSMVLFELDDGAFVYGPLPKGWDVHRKEGKWRIAPESADRFGIVITDRASQDKVAIATRYLERYFKLAGYRPQRTGGSFSILKSLQHGPLSFDQIVVSVWVADPGRFGLKSMEQQHPCSRRLWNLLYAKHGPMRAGLVVKIAADLYQLTETGKKRFAELSHH